MRSYERNVRTFKVDAINRASNIYAHEKAQISYETHPSECRVSPAGKWFGRDGARVCVPLGLYTHAAESRTRLHLAGMYCRELHAHLLTQLDYFHYRRKNTLNFRHRLNTVCLAQDIYVHSAFALTQSTFSRHRRRCCTCMTR